MSNEALTAQREATIRIWKSLKEAGINKTAAARWISRIDEFTYQEFEDILVSKGVVSNPGMYWGSDDDPYPGGFSFDNWLADSVRARNQSFYTAYSRIRRYEARSHQTTAA